MFFVFLIIKKVEKKFNVRGFRLSAKYSFILKKNLNPIRPFAFYTAISVFKRLLIILARVNTN